MILNQALSDDGTGVLFDFFPVEGKTLFLHSDSINVWFPKVADLKVLFSVHSAAQEAQLRIYLSLELRFQLGCVRLGNLDFDFGFRISDFPIKREIQKRISTSRNPFPRQISIKAP